MRTMNQRVSVETPPGFLLSSTALAAVRAANAASRSSTAVVICSANESAVNISSRSDSNPSGSCTHACVSVVILIDASTALVSSPASTSAEALIISAPSIDAPGSPVAVNRIDNSLRSALAFAERSSPVATRIVSSRYQRRKCSAISTRRILRSRARRSAYCKVFRSLASLRALALSSQARSAAASARSARLAAFSESARAAQAIIAEAPPAAAPTAARMMLPSMRSTLVVVAA